MLVTTLLQQNPAAVVEIVRHTPVWVGFLLVGLLFLGFSVVRPRDVHIGRHALLPLAMIALALWGVHSAFAATGRLAQLLMVWTACFAVIAVLGARLSPPAGARYDVDTHRFHLPGSWLPMLLILAVFLMKYGVGVQLAMEPPLAYSADFAFPVAAAYGLLSGVFAARALRVLRLARPTAPLASA